MAKKNTLTKALAVTGSILVWFPLLLPIFFSIIVFSRAGVFHFDFLMPAELFPAALTGGGVLTWAARRARSHQKLVGWGLAIALVLLVGGQTLAVVTGMASGETEPAAWLKALVLGSIGGYGLALTMIGVGGILLVRDLFWPMETDALNHPG